MAIQSRSSTELLEKLRQRTKSNIVIAEQLAALPDGALDQRPDAKSWSALDCLAHLNHYSAYYLPEIRRRMKESSHQVQSEFTSSRLGNYFAASMKPSTQMKKINTFKSANPLNFVDKKGRSILNVFLKEQAELLELLNMAAKVDLTKTKTGISITQLVKLRLGDTLRVVVYHNWRHLEQAQRAAIN